MPSKRSDRTPPSRNFDDYILSREQGPGMGILKVPSDTFSHIPGIVGSPWQTGSANTSISDPIDIGFPFKFDGTTYRQFIVTTKGWMVLIDPTVGSFTYTDVIGPANDSTDIGDHYRIKISGAWPHNHTLLAPWFSGALVNLAENLRSSGNAGTLYPTFASTYVDLYEKGYWNSSLDAVIDNRDPVGYAVRYCLQDKTPQGRRLIVRWDSWVNLAYVFGGPAGQFINSAVTFEVVLYENGRIEFRYCPRNTFDAYVQSLPIALGLGYVEPRAATGIFKRFPAAAFATWKFRDFSPGLSYRDDDRNLYTLGGSTYDPSYSDTYVLTTPYSVNLTLSKHWPGDNSSGGRFVFQPPMRRRKVLPRLLIKDIDSRNVLPTVARTGDRRMGNQKIYFDDRRSIAYTSGTVNYPTTLPRFYGNTSEGVAGRQDLFAGDFLIDAAVVKSNVQQFIGNEDQDYVAPFEDHKRFENDPDAVDDPFFLVGTSVTEVGMGFKQPLKAKTQIKLSFNVDEKTILRGDKSSIYYYNKKNRRWQYPTKAVDVSPLSDANEVPSAEMDVDNAITSILQHRVVEIDRGFNAYGVPICSGTALDAARLPPNGERTGTDPIFNSLWTPENETVALGKGYGNNFQTHIKYSPTDAETFTLPINQPFLIEKAVIELPLEAGPSWFLDKTQCYLPRARGPAIMPYATYVTNSLGDDVGIPDSYRSNGFHIGGPALTFSMFNNVKTGVETSRRELILSGTITHHHDIETEIKLYDYEGDIDEVWQVVPRGINAYGTPSSVIYPTETSEKCGRFGCVPIEFFTGSAKLNCQAAISNGVIVRDTIFANYEGTAPPDPNPMSDSALPVLIDYVFDSDYWSAGSPIGPLASSTPLSYFVEDPLDPDKISVYGFREKTIVGVNNLCRGATGFEQSGRSIFGKEFVTDTIRSYANPFKLYDVNGVKDYLKLLAIGVFTKTVAPKIFFTQVPPTQKVLASPYLVLPGDKISITLSKTRPFCFNGHNPSGSLYFDPLLHDIKLNTGSLNITLYGSLVSNGSEYHDTLNQPLASDAIKETFIGGTKTW